MSDDKPGATGEFPEGQLGPRDEGELNIAIAADPDRNVVIMDFGKPVAWLAMEPDHARGFISMIEKAIHKLQH